MTNEKRVKKLLRPNCPLHTIGSDQTSQVFKTCEVYYTPPTAIFMNYQIQHKGSAGTNKVVLPAQFIAICVLAFIAGISATVYFYRSMCCDMKMPGGWTMSMMWMRMPGTTWFGSVLGFLLMWLAMMVPMMLPSALPMFLKTRRQWSSLCYMASGYFAIWLAGGIGIYALGIAFMKVAMRSASVSHVVPLLSGALLITAGAIQFTRWKRTYLLRCRSQFGCAVSSVQCETGFRLGCKQGVACFVCCISPMAVLLALGIMDPIVMLVVAAIIAAEKMLPRPEITARLVGIAVIFAGATTIVASFGF